MKGYLVLVFVLCVASVQAGIDFTSNGFQSRIINGNNATVNQFPYFVSIVGRLANDQTTLCGGALISNAFVITAAHCVLNIPTITVGMGSNNLNMPQVSMIAASRVIHPNYNPSTYANDIAVLRLPINVTFTPSIQSVRLPALSQANNPFLNAAATIVGYGRVTDQSSISQNLRFARTRIIANNQCASFYGNSVVGASALCTLGFDFNAQGPCANDNGGPLTILEGNINTLVGIASFISNNGCGAGHPAGYVRISTLTQWISQQVGIPTRP